jgi:hypothetical protein
MIELVDDQQQAINGKGHDEKTKCRCVIKGIAFQLSETEIKEETEQGIQENKQQRQRQISHGRGAGLQKNQQGSSFQADIKGEGN